MVFFKKKNKEVFDIYCRDRTLKNLIDSSFTQKVTNDLGYEDRIIFYVKEGIKYRNLLKQVLEDGYSKHKSDITCDIPDYKTFLSLEQAMIDDREQYQHKSICVEGYIAYSLCPSQTWSRDNGVFIYPLPCETDSEVQINYALVDDCNATESIILVSDRPLPTKRGMHIRVHGEPSFHKAWDGGRPAKVHILVHEYEILE